MKPKLLPGVCPAQLTPPWTGNVHLSQSDPPLVPVLTDGGESCVHCWSLLTPLPALTNTVICSLQAAQCSQWETSRTSHRGNLGKYPGIFGEKYRSSHSMVLIIIQSKILYFHWLTHGTVSHWYIPGGNNNYPVCGWLLLTLRQQVVEICLPRIFRHNLIVNLFWFKHQSCGEINDSFRLKNIDKNYKYLLIH